MSDETQTAARPDWQPIATAPKDDVIILTDGGNFYQGFWQNGRGWMTGVTSGALTMHLMLDPTHWMPLPKGPMS